MELMNFDHVAVISENIAESVEWYKNNFSDVVVEYQDETWAMCKVNGLNLAFVMKAQHPPHIAFCITKEDAENKHPNKIFKKHRDGTSSCYIKDIDNNILELLIR